jgi:hypothetical protein
MIGLQQVGILAGMFSWQELLQIWRESPLFSKGGLSFSKRRPIPPFLGKKVVAVKFLIPKCTYQIFLWYWYGKYQEDTN